MTTDPGRLHFGVVRVDLHLPGVTSLKGKRGLLKRVDAALRNELGCSVAEVGFQDTWQRAALGVAVAAGSAGGVDRVVDRVRSICERDPRVVVTSAMAIVDVVDVDEGEPLPPGWT